MKNLKYLLLLGVTVLFGCKSNTGHISEVKKAIVFPGVPQGNTTIEYTAKIEVLKPVEIVSINVMSDKDKLPVTEYSIVSLTDGTVLDHNKVIQKGTYFFKTNLAYDKALENSSDKLIVKLKKQGSNKVLTYKISVGKAETKMRR